ncbi:hypothetical protein SELMODRAFT_78184 [Selaginella moellendorffii]|uniref:Uncharacterized protein n=1 Tax=Selaginella moellendorffii TaxID=88036 RepID=D8QWA1_SELML|nr:uncharacterized protein LOC9643345 [Selaginella moellendorffii]EFJ36196.1 hypothetical protein SELMODRAFT_78184 [Selaginella moellendorffii]|eukprot:XP_002962733.1 uncharacterized protein LOC9643345 [Selaginella moellendorffii]
MNGGGAAILPAMAGILDVAARRGVSLELKKLGPFFTVIASNSKDQALLGEARGVIRPWIDGMVLHLDSIRMTRASKIKQDKPLFGVALVIGAAAIRHGYDCGCSRAELLAINDSDLYHSKLRRYYQRVGFEAVYEVSGESLRDLPHMLVWGGIGTRMDASIHHLLVKWSKVFDSGGQMPLTQSSKALLSARLDQNIRS